MRPHAPTARRGGWNSTAAGTPSKWRRSDIYATALPV
jgi:hypothetical protein